MEEQNKIQEADQEGEDSLIETERTWKEVDDLA